jgi:transposase-like protein
MEEKKDTEHRYSPEQQVKIVKEALTTDRCISGICRKFGISSGLFYK